MHISMYQRVGGLKWRGGALTEFDGKRWSNPNRGSQRIDARTLTPGLWKVRVSWTVADKEYYIDRSIVVPGPPA